jgi:quercetin dioxygenase-like cupin family protein
MRFFRRVVAVPPGGVLDYEEADWRDALVIVVRGEIQLESRGGRERFARGAVLSLAGLPLRALHNDGAEPAELLAVRRRRAGRAARAGR